MNEEENANCLMPPSLRAIAPGRYSQEELGLKAMVVAKYFTPDAQWTWYVVEFDPESRECYGLVKGFEAELGYFTLNDLEEIRGGLCLPVERDLYWVPKQLGKVMTEEGMSIEGFDIADS